MIRALALVLVPALLATPARSQELEPEIAGFRELLLEANDRVVQQSARAARAAAQVKALQAEVDRVKAELDQLKAAWPLP